jgi:hypothetical protein
MKGTAMSLPNEKKPITWSVIVRLDDSGRWYRGAARFPTREDAEEYAHNYYQTHSIVRECRVVPAPEGANNTARWRRSEHDCVNGLLFRPFQGVSQELQRGWPAISSELHAYVTNLYVKPEFRGGVRRRSETRFLTVTVIAPKPERRESCLRSEISRGNVCSCMHTASRCCCSHVPGFLYFRGIGVEKMWHLRLAEHVTVDSLLQLAIRFCLPLVLT